MLGLFPPSAQGQVTDTYTYPISFQSRDDLSPLLGGEGEGGPLCWYKRVHSTHSGIKTACTVEDF